MTINLNEQQQAAVDAPTDRPVLVIAGAGSGKTATLVRRVDAMVEAGIDPDSILALTFSKKAAEEMTERISVPVAASTLHAFGYSRIRDWRTAQGLPTLELVTNPKSHVQRLMQRKSPGYPQAVETPESIAVASVLAAIGGWQNELVTPSEAIAYGIEEGFPVDEIAKVYRAYVAWKKDTNRMDFDDMLTMCVDIYQSDPAFLAADRGRWSFGLVDELQDTNTAQWALLDLLFGDTPLFGVGDVRQAIYEWRGARPGQLVDFPNRWRDTLRLDLTINYRSTPEIVSTAQELIGHAPSAEKIGADLDPFRPSGDDVEVLFADDLTDEAAAVTLQIGQLLRNGTRGGDVAVLYRTNAQSVDLEDELSAAKIPYQVIGSRGFWGRREVVDLLAYLRLAVDEDDAEAFSRALAAPSRYLGRAFVEACQKASDVAGVSLVGACDVVTSYNGRSMSRTQTGNASRFAQLISSISETRWKSPGEALKQIVDTTRFREWLNKEVGSGGDDDVSDIVDQLIRVADSHNTIGDLLDHAAQQQAKISRSTKPDPEKVQLLTIHRSKGLEWENVFFVGVAEGLIPHAKSENLSEERRLAYVAMTRARDRLVVSTPAETFRGSTSPSRFLTEAGLIEPVEPLRLVL